MKATSLILLSLSMAADAAAISPCASMKTADLSSVPDAPTSIVKAEATTGEGDAVAYCQVEGYVNPNVGFAIRLPLEQWNGKFLQLGCGGFCGTLSPANCDRYVRRGYACIVSDNGHKGSAGGAVWAYNNWQAEIDHAFRGAHVTALAGKAIVERYYGQAPRKSYFMGASTGGRQALMEAQRFPWDFDGIVAGVPSLPVPALHMSLLWGNRAITNGTDKPILEQTHLDLLHRAVIDRCEMNDGVEDGQIGDPRRCDFDPAVLLCRAGSQTNCLTAQQIAAVDKIYRGPVDSKGEQIYFPGALKGSELSWRDWFAYMYSDNPSGIYNFVRENFRYAGFDPDPGPQWRPEDFDFDRDYKRLGVAEALYTAGNPDLRRFKAAGGKLIVYHGWNDAGGMPLPTIDYYETVERVFAGRAATQAFFRLFLIPGMNHGPNKVDGGFETDWLSYLESWVEKAEAPDKIIYHHIPFKEGQQWPPQWPLDRARIDFSRPAFPYPSVAKYSGRGDPQDAASFIAVSP